MAQAIRHASSVKPISIPVKADVDADNWDRVQSLSAATSQPLEKVYEIGRLTKMTDDKETLEATLSITQLEYGEIASFLQLAGLAAEPGSGLQLSDFDDSRTDFYQPGKDEYGGTLEQTLWLQKMVLDSFTLDITAEERLQRTFELSGDFCKILRQGNKYLIFTTNDAPSGTSGNYEITVNDPVPVVDPNNAGVYILMLWRIRSGVATELELTTDYTYSNITNKITIISASAGDHYRIWYSAASYGSGGDPTSLNDSDDYFLKADSVTVLVNDGTHADVELTRLTSLSCAATFNRIDEGVIGSDEKILKDVESYDVSVSMAGFVKDSSIEEVLMLQAGQSWGIIDFSLFDEISVTIKVYEDSTKASFKIGYKITGCQFADESRDFTANEFADKPLTVNSDNLLITTDVGNL